MILTTYVCRELTSSICDLSRSHCVYDFLMPFFKYREIVPLIIIVKIRKITYLSFMRLVTSYIRFGCTSC